MITRGLWTFCTKEHPPPIPTVISFDWPYVCSTFYPLVGCMRDGMPSPGSQLSLAPQQTPHQNKTPAHLLLQTKGVENLQTIPNPFELPAQGSKLGA